MCRIQVFGSGPHIAVDRSWRRHWLTDVQDEQMRNRIFGDQRFAERIADDILSAEFDHSDPLIEHFDDQNLLSWFLSCDRSDFLRRAGILWFAPTLADALTDPKSRAAIGLTDREDLKAVFEYRNHTSAEIVGSAPPDVDYSAEGLRCCLAWLSGLPRSVADRVRLLWPAADRTEDDGGHRRAFFETLLTTAAGPAA